MFSSTASFKGIHMANHFKLQKAAIAVSGFLALASVQINGMAQAADSGTVVVSGQITSTTCNVVISDPGVVGSTATKTLNLGSFASPTTGNGTLGTTFGTPVAVVFTVAAANTTTTPCTFASPNTKWDLALNLSSSQISSIGTATFLKNNITSANGGTDAVVQLKGGIGTTAAAATTTLSLIGDAGINGTLASGSLLPTATSTSSIALTAQFARGTTGAPSGGAFSQTIPLIARYN